MGITKDYNFLKIMKGENDANNKGMKISEFKDAVVRQVVMEKKNMPLVKAQCPNCGGILEINNNNEAFVCKYCGVPCITEKAVNNYNIVNNNDIHDSVVNIYNMQENKLTAADYFNRCIEYMKIKEIKEARKHFIEARRLDPENEEYIVYGHMNGIQKMSVLQFVSKFREIQSWEKDYLKSADGFYRQQYFWDYFGCNDDQFIDRSRCEYILNLYPDVKLGLPVNIFSLSNSGLVIKNSEKWQNLNKIEFLFQHDINKTFHPYESVFIENMSDVGIRGIDRSIYDIVLHGGIDALRIYSPKIRELKLLSPNLDLAKLIEKYYPYKAGECPCCHKRLSFFGKCKKCGRIFPTFYK